MSGLPSQARLKDVAVDAGCQLWDVIVVGAGPAGCAAAYDLAVGGQSVLLLDKNDFPRNKACAGGLTIKAVQALRYSVAPVIRETVGRIRLADGGTFPSPSDILLKSRAPICVMTVRAELDEFCLRKTIAAGAGFERVSAIQRILRAGDRVEVWTASGCYQARFVVGADGASGQVRRLCGEGSWFSQGFALEVRTAIPEKNFDLTFDFGSIPQGYAWVFPKKDHLNVGLYCRSSAGKLTRSGLLAYLKAAVGGAAMDEVTGQYLGMGAGEYQEESIRPELRDRIFLVGDAGGFVDPLTGEGIYGALLSGQAAAQAILLEARGTGAAMPTFTRHLSDYRQTLRFSSRAATAFYANPARGFRAMRLPFVRGTLVKTYTRGLNVKSLAVRMAVAAC